MIETKYPTDDVFEDAVQATAYIARVDVRYGELTLPHRVREHLADGDVVVHLVRGDNDESVLTAQLTAGSKLVGIEWPADITAGTRVTVMCPRGSTSHDIGVLLPDLNVDWPDDDLPEREPESEIVFDPDDVEEVSEVSFARPEDWREIDVQIIRENGGAVAGELPRPAEFATTTTLQVVERDEQPTETILAVAWPATAPEPAEQTAIVPAVGTLPTRRGWFALAWFHVVAWFASLVNAVAARVENVGQDVIDHAWVVAKVLVAAVAVLVLAGSGVLWLLLEVAR